MNLLTAGDGTTNRASGAVEEGQHPITRQPNALTSKAVDIVDQDSVVTGHQVGPRPIPQPLHHPGRIDDVGEKDRDQHPLPESVKRTEPCSSPSQETLSDAWQDGLRFYSALTSRPRQLTVAGSAMEVVVWESPQVIVDEVLALLRKLYPFTVTMTLSDSKLSILDPENREPAAAKSDTKGDSGTSIKGRAKGSRW